MTRNWFALVQNDDETGNPTLEIGGEGHGIDYMTVTREITVEEMENLADALAAQVQQIRIARQRDPNWATRSYSVGPDRRKQEKQQ